MADVKSFLGELMSRLGKYGAARVAIGAAGMALMYGLLQAVLNVFFHPLSSYPGPPLAVASRICYCYYLIRGNLRLQVQRLHKKYGVVVRIAPDELSYIDPQAWNDIYGHRLGKRELMKNPAFYSYVSSGPKSILSAPTREHHGFLRKHASHGFSERALKEQEHVIKHYADVLLDRLEECAQTSGRETQDIVDWYNFFTFDVIGDLVFGQSFHCLDNWGYHPWVKLLFDSVKAGSWIRAIRFWSSLTRLAPYVIPPDLRRRRVEQRVMALEKASWRKSLDDGRQDLLSGYLLPNSGVSYQEYVDTAQTFVIAGRSRVCGNIKKEIRNAFFSEDRIDCIRVTKLPYLLACLDETFRMYPPVSETFPSNTGDQPDVICGREVPRWTTVGVHQWSVYHSSRYFKDPDAFVPERWLSGNKDYKDDRRDVVNPFLVGPRNCMGRNVAHFEMRHLMCRVLFTSQHESRRVQVCTKFGAERAIALHEAFEQEENRANSVAGDATFWERQPGSPKVMSNAKKTLRKKRQPSEVAWR